LEDKVPQIREYEVGKNMSASASSFDLVLVSGFESEEDLEAYRRHPEHVKVLDFIGKVKDMLAVVDYTT
ncbi:MAG TPA: Dabb family protein, partial [Bacteroidales bacterium]|nr:Dabb family protein [Bacteroidales bacterium]